MNEPEIANDTYHLIVDSVTSEDKLISSKTEQTVLGKIAAEVALSNSDSKLRAAASSACLDLTNKLDSLQLPEVHNYLSFISGARLCTDQLKKQIASSARKIDASKFNIRAVIHRFLTQNACPVTAAEALNDKLKENEPWLWFDLATTINEDLALTELWNFLESGEGLKQILLRLPSLWKDSKFGAIRHKEFFEKLLSYSNNLKEEKAVLAFAKSLGGFQISSHQLNIKKSTAAVLEHTKFKFDLSSAF